MIADALRVEIERYAGRCRSGGNALFRMTEAGLVGRAAVTRYIANVHFLISHTPDYLTRARDGAAARGDTKLAAHFQHKLEEEVGHDVWAERDLESLTQMCAETPSVDVLPSMGKLVDYLAEVIATDPALYLAYIAFAEYFIVILGPEWLTMLEDKCGIPRSSMSVIANHIELDQEHAEEAFGLIDDLVADPKKLKPMRDVLLNTLRFYDGFSGEVSRITGEADARATVSAA